MLSFRQDYTFQMLHFLKELSNSFPIISIHIGFFPTSWIPFCDKSASRLTPINDIDGTWNIIFLVFLGVENA